MCQNQLWLRPLLSTKRLREYSVKLFRYMRKVNKSIECVDRGLDLLLYILASEPTHHKISKMAIGKRFLQQALYVRQNPFRIQHLPRQYLTSAAAPALYGSNDGCRSLSTSKKLLKYSNFNGTCDTTTGNIIVLLSL